MSANDVNRSEMVDKKGYVGEQMHTNSTTGGPQDAPPDDGVTEENKMPVVMYLPQMETNRRE
jgi:hypothetical protein